MKTKPTKAPKKSTIDPDDDNDKSRLNFTDPTLKSLMTKGVRRYTDASQDGLRFVVNAKGEGRFQVRFQEPRTGKQRTRNLPGQYCNPAPRPTDAKFKSHVSLSKARKEATDIRADAAAGLTVMVVGNRKRAGAILFRDDVETFFEANRGKWKPVKAYDTNEYIDHEMWARRHLKHAETLMDLPTVSITSRDIVAVLKATRAKRHAAQYRLSKDQPMLKTTMAVRNIIRQVITHAMMTDTENVRWPKDATHPSTAARYLYALPKAESVPHHSVPLAPDEHSLGIQDLYAGLVHFKYHPHHPETASHLALRFVTLTCSPRKKEVRLVKWEDLHLDRYDPQWWVPNKVMKVSKAGRQYFIRPLSHAAVALLRSIKPADARPFDLVFPSIRKGTVGQPISRSTLNRFLKDNFNQRFTVHGFRHAFMQFVAKYYPDRFLAAQRALDHDLKAVIGVSATYMTSDLMDQRRLLAELWCQFLEAKLPPEERTPQGYNDPILHETPPWAQSPQLPPQLQALGPV